MGLLFMMTSGGRARTVVERSPNCHLYNRRTIIDASLNIDDGPCGGHIHIRFQPGNLIQSAPGVIRHFPAACAGSEPCAESERAPFGLRHFWRSSSLRRLAKRAAAWKDASMDRAAQRLRGHIGQLFALPDRDWA
jgi:hypothetical protein